MVPRSGDSPGKPAVLHTCRHLECGLYIRRDGHEAALFHGDSEIDQLFRIFRSVFCYLAYRNGQSVDLTVIRNPVFTLSRDLSFPFHVISGTT